MVGPTWSWCGQYSCINNENYDELRFIALNFRIIRNTLLTSYPCELLKNRIKQYVDVFKNCLAVHKLQKEKKTGYAYVAYA